MKGRTHIFISPLRKERIHLEYVFLIIIFLRNWIILKLKQLNWVLYFIEENNILLTNGKPLFCAYKEDISYEGSVKLFDAMRIIISKKVNLYLIYKRIIAIRHQYSSSSFIIIWIPTAFLDYRRQSSVLNSSLCLTIFHTLENTAEWKIYSEQNNLPCSIHT